MAGKRALMFKTENRGVPSVFVFAVRGPDGHAAIVTDSGSGVAEILLSRYAADMILNGGPSPVIRHAIAFRPVTVPVRGDEEFASSVVGLPMGGVVEIRTSAGTMSGIECVGPGALDAYNAGEPVPWLALIPTETETPS